MENDNTFEPTEISFPKEIGKTLVLATATSVGVWTGIAIVAIGYSKITDKLDARRAKKNLAQEA